jgi:hypothetical protein
MGARLVEFYEKADKEFGPKGRMKLALLTAISSTKAITEEDSAENITKFVQAMIKIRLSPE